MRKKIQREPGVNIHKTNTLHIEGFGRDIDLLEKMSNKYDLRIEQCFEEPVSDVIPNVFFRFYSSSEKCTLEESMEGNLKKLFGSMDVSSQEFGYSEVTIDGFDVLSAHMGGHDLQVLINSHTDEYLHVLIDFNI